MKDRLRFTTERRGDHIAVRCCGFDRNGQAVDFELDAETFRDNSMSQLTWVTRVAAAGQIMAAYIAVGVDPDSAWTMTEAALPDDMHLGTGWRGQLGDQRGDVGRCAVGDHAAAAGVPRL